MARKKTRVKRSSVVTRLRAQIRKLRIKRKSRTKTKSMSYGNRNRGGGRRSFGSFRKPFRRQSYGGGQRRTGLRILGIRMSFPKMLLWVGAGALILIFGKSKIMPFIENLKSKI
jgi:hypothetical protein